MIVAAALLLVGVVTAFLSWTNPGAVDGWAVIAFFSTTTGVVVAEYEAAPPLEDE